MDPAAADPPPRRRRLLLALTILVALAAGAWWLFRDRDEQGVIAAMRWAHTTQLERWQDVTRSGWRQDLVFTAGVAPVQGAGEVAAVLVTQCVERVHHEETYPCGVETFNHREAYRCGSERKCQRVRREGGKRARWHNECEDVPRTCYRDIPEERGKLCTRPVHADWCDYLTQEWVPTRSEQIEGDAHLGLRFPDLAPGGDFERSRNGASYTITVAYPGGVHTAVVPRGEYDQWNPGDPAVVQVETAGGVLGFTRPAAAPPR
jgi:hypothetical protein